MPGPTVVTLMAAHDAEGFVGEALRSVLAQEWPADRLRVVVVDDGSTDGTADVVARVADEHPGRVELIRQDNGGQVAAINRAAEAAAGADVLAFLDADDTWPADKLRHQVAVLEERPEVGLVYTDMRVVDAGGAVMEESWLEGVTPPSGSAVGPFLAENHIVTSSIVLRGALHGQMFPIPSEMAWPDWWLAVRCAQVASVAFLPEPRGSYRFHGRNMSLGAQGAARLAELRKGLRLQRWFLRSMTAADTTVADLEHAWDAFAGFAAHALEAAGSPFARLVEVSEGDRAEAVAGAAASRELLAAGLVHEALAAGVRAAACDPGCDATRGALLAARAAVPSGRGPQPLNGAHPFVVAVQADELLRDPSLLGRCAEELGGLTGVTVAIDASAAPAAEATQRVQALVAAAGLEDDPRLDLLLVTGPLDELGLARLAYGTSAYAGIRPDGDGKPWFSPDRLDGLRALALAAATGAP